MTVISYLAIYLCGVAMGLCLSVLIELSHDQKKRSQ